MADPADPSANDPQSVGNVFVQQYYSILHESPEQVHKFYHDVSVLSRLGSDGVMTSVTTLKCINDTILSLDYQNYKAEIYSADSQVSYKDSVIVLVTGCLTGKDNVSRQFTQSFFLAPQERGYYVLNDILRYVDREEVVGITIDAVDESAPTVALTPDHDPTHVPNHSVVMNHSTTLEKDPNDGKEVSHLLDDGKVPVVPVVPVGDHDNDKVPVVDHDNGEVSDVSVVDHPVSQNAVSLAVAQSQNAVHPPAETASSNIQEDAPKKSYASIVNALKGNTTPFLVRVPPPKLVEQPRRAVSAPPEASAPSSNSALERKERKERNSDRTVKGHSIFVANLPMDATVEQLEETFKQFGSIKADGLQVRSHKGMQGRVNCYGFVEFESASSVQSALQASPIMIGNRKAPIEEKRGNNDGGKFPPARGGYRNDNFKGRENFNGGRNYRRNEFEKRGEGQARRNGEGNKKAIQNGGGRATREVTEDVA